MAKKLLHYVLGTHEHNIVMGCKTAKQMWELLQITSEKTLYDTKKQMRFSKNRISKFTILLAQFFGLIIWCGLQENRIT